MVSHSFQNSKPIHALIISNSCICKIFMQDFHARFSCSYMILLYDFMHDFHFVACFSCKIFMQDFLA